MTKEFVLTSEGYEKLIAEVEHLTHKRRKEVAARIKSAIEFGDISENSEYEDAKNEQAFVEGRIIQVNNMLANAALIDDKSVTTDKVSVGCCVSLLDIECNEKCVYRVVGSVEADPENEKISNESPVGRAILGKRIGQIVKVEVPSGFVEYQVLDISK